MLLANWSSRVCKPHKQTTKCTSRPHRGLQGLTYGPASSRRCKVIGQAHEQEFGLVGNIVCVQVKATASVGS